jgi:hypothetical protein
VPQAAKDVVFARTLMPVVLEDTKNPFGNVAPIFGAAGMMMRTADRDLLTAAISFTVAAFVVFSRRNPLWALGAGACVSVVALHLSRFH